MPISRRTFLRAGVVAGATLPLIACAKPQLPTLDAASMPVPDADSARPDHISSLSDEPLPTLALITLNRLAFGPRPGDLERVHELGLEAYLDEQLAPDDADDPELAAVLAGALLPIAYEAYGDYPAIDERRPLSMLDASLETLWPLGSYTVDLPWPERVRPADEVRAATWLRAVYSRWQLREVLTHFWHDHFNVAIYYVDARIDATWPRYDALLRRSAFGNFRTLLEEVATSPAMLYYLNNTTSRTGPANENYARELFELHTLGAEHYLNDRYTSWREVPGATEGLAAGYIDDDVYEAARAFTGWTVADGMWLDDGSTLPDTGEFFYLDAWHDHYQKRILGVELPSHGAPMADGRAVLDLVAFHPGTARHLCMKLCRRLVGDHPSPALVERAMAVWIAQQHAPDQIGQTVRAIVLAPEFAHTWGQKLKRPFELVAALLRATGTTVTAGHDLSWAISGRGQDLFAWPAPNGLPDHSAFWLSTQITLGRWSLPVELLNGWYESAAVDLWAHTPTDASVRSIVQHWCARLLGRSAPASTAALLATFFAQGGDLDAPPAFDDDSDRSERLAYLIALIAATPEFQLK
jgi:uncharacterized protein (DUF1800 family)